MFQASIFWRNSRANAVLMILFGMIPLATGQTVEQDQVNAAAQNLTLFEDV